MSAFENYKNPSEIFDSFSGTELQAFLKVTTEYDEFGQAKKFDLIKIGSISQIAATERYENVPNVYIGFDRPSSISTGSSLVVGSITFEVLNKGFLTELKETFKKHKLKKTSFSYENSNLHFVKKDRKFINDFPLFDLVLLGVKENDPDKKIQLEIKGIKLSNGTSGIGVTQIIVKEQYQFMAKTLHNFKPVEGAKVEEARETNDNVENADELIFL